MDKYLERERALRAARNGRGGSLGNIILKTFFSGFGSEQQFKLCSGKEYHIFIQVVHFLRSNAF
jgi:hypothetical protein